MDAQRVVGGRYRLVSKLGSGGMGTVWLAHDERLGREVALKEVRAPASVSDEERRDLGTRAMAEARSAARLDHPNIVSVYDAFEDEGMTWIVMQLVRGMSLDEAVRAQARLPAPRAAAVGLALLDALDAAHAAGILHRDLKPSNVMVTESGHVMLTDFSIAAALDGAGLTRTGVLLGTPGYVAPERLTSGSSGPSVDLFGLGATLYFAVEGHGPFERDTPLAELFATVNQPHPPPEHAGPLGQVIDGLLVKEPDQRWTAARTREALQPVVTSRLSSPGRPASGTRQVPTDAIPDDSTLEGSHSLALAHSASGAGSAPVVPASGGPSAAPKPGWRTWLIGAIVLVLLGGLGLAGRTVISAFGGGDGGGPDDAPTEPAPREETLRITAAGDTAQLTFTGAADQTVFVQVASSTMPDECNVIELIDPNDDSLARGCIINGVGFIDTTTLPVAGDYKIVIDPEGDTTGEAHLKLFTTTDQAGVIQPNGEEIRASIGQPGERARFTFTGEAKQLVYVEALSATVPDGCRVLQLRLVDGDEVGNGCIIGGKGGIDRVELPSDGDYAIVVDPDVAGTGTARLRLHIITDQLGELTVDGSEVLVTIDQPGKVARLSFEGTADQKIFIEATDATLEDCGILILLDPDGEQEGSRGCIISGKGHLEKDGLVLAKSGTYTVVVDPSGGHMGNAQIRVRT